MYLLRSPSARCDSAYFFLNTGHYMLLPTPLSLAMEHQKK
jgi:hypothetical protein